MLTRDRRPERMDDPTLPPTDHLFALRGLERINRFSGSAAAVWPHVAALATRPVRVLDVATGSGDIPVSLDRRARRSNLPIAFAGCDISPVAVEAARSRAPLDWFVHDVLTDPLPTGFDVVTCSLFLHHLDPPDAVTLLSRMATAAGRRVVVHDLSRGRANYALVWLACRLLSRSPVVHADGPLSVRAAFTPREALALADQAGLTGATVRPAFPCRFVLTWDQPA